MREFLKYPEWARAGQGRAFQFYATDEEFQHLLSIALLEAFGPYSLLRYEVVKRIERYRQILHEHDVADFLTLRKQNCDTFYLRSKKLTPMIPLGEHDRVDADLSTNGLVRMSQGLYSKRSGRLPSSLGIVNRVCNEKTGEVIEHKEYDRVFAALKRAAKKLLRYDLIQHLPNGESYPLKGIRMSEEFAKLMAAGEVKTNVSIA